MYITSNGPGSSAVYLSDCRVLPVTRPKEMAREKRHVRDAERRVGRFPRTFAVAPPTTMSETLSAPWITDYLINIAETYGCSLSNVPIHVKPGKRVQLLQASREQWRCTRHSSVLTLITTVPHLPPICRGRLRLGLCL